MFCVAFKLPNHVIQNEQQFLDLAEIHIRSQSKRPDMDHDQGGTAMQESCVIGRSVWLCVRVCWCVYVYKRAEPEQVNMFTGELIQSADADPRPPRQAGVGAEQVWNRRSTLRMCNHDFIKYYRRNIIGRLTFSL